MHATIQFTRQIIAYGTNERYTQTRNNFPFQSNFKTLINCSDCVVWKETYGDHHKQCSPCI